MITDLNLVFNELRHTALLDLHIELTSPSGTTVVLIRSFNEGGILSPISDFRVDFIGTVLDDQAPTNLVNGVQPYTGSFNIEHSSVVSNPLAQFNGENALGTWTLVVSDQVGADSGNLVAWSLQFTGTLDTDGDGIPDDEDNCSETPAGAVVNTEGCAIVQLCPCENVWKNHGAYVRCVAQAAEDFVGDDLITEAEKDAIVSEAGASSCGHK